MLLDVNREKAVQEEEEVEVADEEEGEVHMGDVGEEVREIEVREIEVGMEREPNGARGHLSSRSTPDLAHQLRLMISSMLWTGYLVPVSQLGG